MDNNKVEFLIQPRTGNLWPFYQGKKALSPSSLTRPLSDIKYKEIPEYVLLKAAIIGKNFHEIIQEFFYSGNYPSIVDQEEATDFNKLDGKVYETLRFLKGDESLELETFIGKEKLYYTFYKGELLASYVDCEFKDYVIELKTNKTSEDYLFLLVFEIQLLIQQLCTGKEIYLLWSTGEGVIFKKFQKTDQLLKVLDMLIDLLQNKKTYSLIKKKTIIKKIMDYKPLLNLKKIKSS